MQIGLFTKCLLVGVPSITWT